MHDAEVVAPFSDWYVPAEHGMHWDSNDIPAEVW